MVFLAQRVAGVHPRFRPEKHCLEVWMQFPCYHDHPATTSIRMGRSMTAILPYWPTTPRVYARRRRRRTTTLPMANKLSVNGSGMMLLSTTLSTTQSGEPPLVLVS